MDALGEVWPLEFARGGHPVTSFTHRGNNLSGGFMRLPGTWDGFKIAPIEQKLHFISKGKIRNLVPRSP